MINVMREEVATIMNKKSRERMMKMSERGRPIGFRAVSEGSLSSYVEGGDCFAVSLRSLKMKR